MISALVLLFASAGTFELRCPLAEVVVKLSDAQAQTCPFEYFNNSQVDVQIWGTSFWNNHKIEIKDTNGEAAALTDKGVWTVTAFEGNSRDSNFPVVLRPGKISRHKTPRLPEYFVLKPGSYNMTITYSDKNFDTPLRLTSKKIAVKVIE